LSTIVFKALSILKLKINNFKIIFFFHPDFTVGAVVSTAQPVFIESRLADFTAGREFHPALKKLFLST
jgi:hypothetical protein